MTADFHTLSSDQVDKLVEYAVSTGYRKPKNASGSRARYFYAYLQRKADVYRKMIAVADMQDKKRKKRK